MKIVLKKFESETGTKAIDYDKVVLVAQNAKLQTKIATKFGLDPEKLSDTLLLNVGDTGAAQGLLGLANALENAKAGDKIFVVDYGNGANAFSLTVTENIAKISEKKQIARYLEKRVEIDSYARFLSWRDIAAAEPARRSVCPPPRLRPGASRTSTSPSTAASARSAVRRSIRSRACATSAAA